MAAFFAQFEMPKLLIKYSEMVLKWMLEASRYEHGIQHCDTKCDNNDSRRNINSEPLVKHLQNNSITIVSEKFFSNSSHAAVKLFLSYH